MGLDVGGFSSPQGRRQLCEIGGEGLEMDGGVGGK